MELTMVKLAVERLHNELEKLKLRNSQLEQEVKELREGMVPDVEGTVVNQKPEEELMDTREVLKYLGICYNTLQSIIRDGFIEPIRINQRRIRFSRKAIQNYIRRLQKSKSNE